MEHLVEEQGRKTDKANAFADDTTVATLCTFELLSTLKNILAAFAMFSGLSCNVEKTTITLIGAAIPPRQEIIDLGFQFVDSFKLLGITLSKNLDTAYTYFDDTLAKIRSIADLWSRTYLTLPGRIMVCKTFMLSLIGYIGCILSPRKHQVDAMQKIFDAYSIGKLRVANNRKYLKPSAGGLGLINLNDFIAGVQCSWVKRIHHHGIDNWRHDILQSCYGNPFILNERTFLAVSNPILHTIGVSFGKFASSFYSTGKNFMKAFIFKNPLIRRGQDDNGLLCENFFGVQNTYSYFEKIARLQICDIWERGGMKSLDSINLETELNFSLLTYMRILQQ